MPKQNELSYRSIGASARTPSTLDPDKRTLDLVIATETPVRMYDWETGEAVPEVLLAKGCVMPRQVPLLDTHSRWSTSDVLGSVRNKRQEEGGLVVGTATFSTIRKADEAFKKYEEGHLTDFSAGYTINDVTRVRKGEKVDLDGRTWKGPVNVATSWTLKEVSCCPIGADAKAKARSDQPFENNHQPPKEDKDMGDNERMDKVENALAQITDTLKTLTIAVSVVTETKRAEIDADAEIKKLREDNIKTAHLTVAAERKRIQEISMRCDELTLKTGVSFDDLRDELIEKGVPLQEAQKRILDRVANLPKPEGQPKIIFTKDEKDKSREVAVDGVMIRSGIAVDKVKDKDTEYQTMSLLELARDRIKIFGGNSRSLDQIGVFQRALQSSDFANILADVANKALLEGFEKAEESYDIWADTTGRVSDFKTHVFARASEAPSLVEVNADGGEYTYGIVTDAKESVAVVDYGIIVPFTRKAMVNDDLGALADIREKLGVAAKRKYGDLVYAVLTANAAMGDGVALFNAATHANYIASGSGAAPSVTTLNVGAKAMAIQKDLQGIQNLNIIPQFILAPWGLKGTVDNLLVTTNPVEIKAAIATAASINPWSYLTRVYDARLDAATASSGWFLAARKGMTIRLFTLNGNMTPLLETREGWAVDGMEFKCRITAAAKAMDWRGLYWNYGA